MVVLFDGPHDVERWEVRARHNELEVGYWVFGGAKQSTFSDAEPAEQGAINERLVVLTIRRGEQVMPMYADLKLEVGDIAAVAIHVDEREAARSLLEGRGWSEQGDVGSG